MNWIPIAGKSTKCSGKTSGVSAAKYLILSHHLTLGQVNTITAAEIFRAVKTVMTAGCDEIRPEMRKALNRLS